MDRKTTGRQHMTVTETGQKTEMGLQHYSPCCDNDLAKRDETCGPRYNFSNENKNKVEIFY
jgi:hypothetical protein